jgi:hypothetical protein
MESAWHLFLSQFSSADPEFTYDDVCAWNSGEFEALSDAGLISEMAQATHVVCDVCPEAHWERVRWSEDGHRAFIPCPLAGALDVNLERLRRWRGSPKQLSVLLAQSLALSREVDPVPASRIWFLGRRRASGRTPYFFFAAIGPDELLSTIEAVRQAYGRVAGVLLLPFSTAVPVETGKLQLVDLGLVVSLRGGHITADFGFIEDQLTDPNPAGVQQGSQAKKASRSLAAHHRAIIKAFIAADSLDGLASLSRRLGVSKSALHGMARGDRKRYSDDKLDSVLKQIGCSRAKWDRAAKPAARA